MPFFEILHVKIHIFLKSAIYILISRFFLCLLQVQGTIHANRCTVEVDEKNPACSLIPLTIPQQVCHPPYEAKTVYVPVIPDPYKHEHSHAHIVV